jgi:hypothetical protein
VLTGLNAPKAFYDDNNDVVDDDDDNDAMWGIFLLGKADYSILCGW